MNTATVSRRERAAAQLLRDLDKIEGRETDPRVEAIANATVKPATVNGSASVGEPVVGGDAVRDDGDIFSKFGDLRAEVLVTTTEDEAHVAAHQPEAENEAGEGDAQQPRHRSG